MKSLTFSPRVVVATSAALAAVVIVLLLGGSKWWNSASRSFPQMQQARAETAALPSAATPKGIESSATASAAPASRLVESQPQALKVAQAEVNQPQANVAEGVASGFPSPVLAQAAVSLPAAATIEVSKTTLAVAAVKPTPSLQKATDGAGKTSSLGRVVEALDGQLIDRVSATRKFEIVGRSDLKAIMEEGVFGVSGNVDPATAAQVGKLTGAKYLLVTSVDDFGDITVKEELKIQKEVIQVRTIQLSAIGKIYDSMTGKLVESANFQVSTNKDITDFATATVEGNRTDVLLVAITRDMASKIANRVACVIYPPKVMDVTGKQVTIDWGDGMFISKGDEWEVCIQKKKKNDVGEEIPIEVPVGRVKITRVDRKASTGEIVGENLGIAEGCVLRKPQ